MTILHGFLFIHYVLLAGLLLTVTQRVCRLETNNLWLNLTYMLISLMWFYLNMLLSLTPFLGAGLLIILGLYVSQAESVQLDARVQFTRLCLIVAGLLAVEQGTHLFLDNVIPNSLTGVPSTFFLIVIVFDILKIIIAWVVPKLSQNHRIFVATPALPMLGQMALSASLLVAASWVYRPLRYSLILIRQISIQSTRFYFFLLTFVIVIILIQYWILWRKKNLETKQQAQQLAQYNANIESLYNQLALFRHDYLNILYSLRLSIEQEDLDSIRQVFEETVSPTRKIVQTDDFEIGKLSGLSAPELKSILYSKFVEAQDQDIQLIVNIEASDQHIPIASSLLVRIIAILLDNSIEAAVQAENKVLTFSYSYAESQFNIVIANTYGSIGDLMSEPLAPTKKLGSTNQPLKNGHGLYYLRQAVEENPQLQLLTEVTETEVKQFLTIRQDR